MTPVSTASRGPAPPLPSTPLVLVTGKGGVGRSTVASAVASALAQGGARVALLHPVDAPPVHPAPHAGARFEVRPLDRDAALDEYLGDNLPGPLAGALRASRAFRLITAATPGLAELITIGELKRLAESGFDHLIYDAPATGHLLALLDAPGRFQRAAGVGPIARRASDYDAWIHDPRHTGIIAVTTGDALAVSELGELASALEARFGRLPDLVVANRLAPPAPTSAELAALDALDDPLVAGAGDAIRALAARGRSERAQLGQITRRFGTAPVQSVERPDAPVAAVLDALASLGSDA